MKKDYRFKDGKYEYCGDKKCDLQEQLHDGDPPHHICHNCIEEYEGEPPEISELKSTVAIRRERNGNV
jgi:hypothetical protein